MIEPQSSFEGLTAAAHARAERERAGRAARDALARAGLVHSETSDTPIIEVDPRASRLNRMKRGTITAARLHQQATERGGFRAKAAMLTLTYRPDVDWSPRHVSDLMKHLRQWLARRGVPARYVWVAELTKAGRVHYHVIVWLRKGLTLPKPDKQGWWPHGLTRIEWARNGVGYMAKYASKGDGDGGGFPKGARIHGQGGLDQDARRERSWWLSPSWVRSKWPAPAYRPARAPGGGWVSRVTGEWMPSPWLVEFKAGRVFIRLRQELPDSSWLAPPRPQAGVG